MPRDMIMIIPLAITVGIFDFGIYKLLAWAKWRTKGARIFAYVLGGYVGLALIPLIMIMSSRMGGLVVGVIVAVAHIAALVGIFYKTRHSSRMDIEDEYTEPIQPDTEIDVDNMTGPEFERFCADLLRVHGYESVYITPGSGDQGIDITADKDGMKWGFQCKRWGTETKVGNNEVMQTYAGKAFYHCDIAAVITTSTFTRKADEYAQQTGVLLWGRDRLFQMMEKLDEEEAEEDPAPPVGGTVREVEFTCQRCGHIWYMTNSEIRSAKAARRQARSMKISRAGTLNLRKMRNLTAQLSIVEQAAAFDKCPACGSHSISKRTQ